MRLRSVVLVLALATSLSPVLAGEPRKPHILVLGTYHMENPGRDVFNAQSDDVRSAKRQRELADLAAMLKKFRPTKILVEAPYGDAKINEQYRQYLAGTFELPSNEREQIAFPLAKAMGHAEVYPIDRQGEFDFDAFAAAARKYGQTGTIDRLMGLGKTYMDELNGMIQTRTIPEVLRWMNDDRRVDEGERFYLQSLRVGKDGDYAGARLVAGWHARNLEIFANVLRATASPDDRILVIYGAGHAKLLTEFAADSGEYVVERPRAYLK